MKSPVPKLILLATVVIGVVSPRVLAQHDREPEGTPLPDYAKVYSVSDDRGPITRDAGGLPGIVITGYWPPTNEMLRQFSNNLEQNPDGWVGGNWEGRGYNIYAFFPEFPHGLGKGEGDFEVDYQDTSNDWWNIIPQIEPVAIITFGRAGNDYNWELEGGHRMCAVDPPPPDPPCIWGNDYLDPRQPTPELPIYDETMGTERWSTLPLQEVVDAVNAEVPALNAFYSIIDDSNFLCNFIGYHATWYHDLHADPEDPSWNVATGHIHVGYHMSLDDAIQATEVTLRALIEYLDTQLPTPGDFDDDDDVDGDDFSAFAVCFTGPGGGPVGSACRPGDFDWDHDVDCADWFRFVEAWTAEGDPPPLAPCPFFSPAVPAWPHDVAKNRYLSFRPNNVESVAFRVEMTASAYFPGATGVLGWVGAAFEAPEDPGVWIARIVTAPVYRDTWPEIVHIADCHVFPMASYEIRATMDELVFTNPFGVSTIAQPAPKYWADVVGTFDGVAWSAPDGSVGMDDVQAAIQKFQKKDTAPHLTWADVDGQVPNVILNFTDIQQIVQGFKGDPYPFGCPPDDPCYDNGGDPANCP